MITKDRIGGVLAAVAALIGLVLVFQGRNSADETRGPSAPSGQVAPAPGGPANGPLVPAPNQPAVPAQQPADSDGD